MAFLSRNLILDLLLTALASAIWGTTYIVTSQFLPPDRPFIAALLRVLPAGIALLIWSRRFPQRGEWAKLIVTGILNIGAFQALLFIAAYRLPGGLAAVIGAIQPLLVMLLAWCVDRQRSPGWRCSPPSPAYSVWPCCCCRRTPSSTRWASARRFSGRSVWRWALALPALGALPADRRADRLAADDRWGGAGPGGADR